MTPFLIEAAQDTHGLIPRGDARPVREAGRRVSGRSFKNLWRGGEIKMVKIRVRQAVVLIMTAPLALFLLEAAPRINKP